MSTSLRGWLEKIDQRTFDTHTAVTEMQAEMRHMASANRALERKVAGQDRRRLKDIAAALAAGAAGGGAAGSGALKALIALLGALLLGAPF